MSYRIYDNGIDNGQNQSSRLAREPYRVSIDKSLSIPGAVAEAKATGQAIKDMAEFVSDGISLKNNTESKLEIAGFQNAEEGTSPKKQNGVIVWDRGGSGQVNDVKVDGVSVVTGRIANISTSNLVHTSGNENISGNKIFNDSIYVGENSYINEVDDTLKINNSGTPASNTGINIKSSNSWVEISGHNQVVITAESDTDDSIIEVGSNAISIVTPSFKINNNEVVTKNYVDTAVSTRALNSDVLHLSGNKSETVTGNKTFSNGVKVAGAVLIGEYSRFSESDGKLTIGNDSPDATGIEILSEQGDIEISSSSGKFKFSSDGDMTFLGGGSNAGIVISDGTVSVSAETSFNINEKEVATQDYVTLALDTKANDVDVVHKTGNETINGSKTFSKGAIFNSGATFNSGAFFNDYLALGDITVSGGTNTQVFSDCNFDLSESYINKIVFDDDSNLTSISNTLKYDNVNVATENYVTTAMASKADNSTVVHLTNNESISGIKTFNDKINIGSHGYIKTDSTGLDITFGSDNSGSNVQVDSRGIVTISGDTGIDISSSSYIDQIAPAITIGSEDVGKANIKVVNNTQKSETTIKQLVTPTEDTDAANKAYVDTMTSSELLWENTSPTSSMGATTITVNHNFVDGERFMVIFKTAAGSGAEEYYTYDSIYIGLNKKHNVIYYTGALTTTTSGRGRQLYFSESNKIVITKDLVNGAGGTGQFLIPYKIYKI